MFDFAICTLSVGILWQEGLQCVIVCWRERKCFCSDFTEY